MYAKMAHKYNDVGNQALKLPKRLPKNGFLHPLFPHKPIPDQLPRCHIQRIRDVYRSGRSCPPPVLSYIYGATAGKSAPKSRPSIRPRRELISLRSL